MSDGVHQFAEKHYRDKLFHLLTPATEWLDLGCGYQLLPGWLKNSREDQAYLAQRCKRLVGADRVSQDILKHPFLHGGVTCNLHHLPFRDNSFSLLTARSVIEHIEHPESFLREAARVLVPGGLLLFATPNLLYYQCLAASVTPASLKKRMVRHLEGRAENDVFKTYYRLNMPSIVRKLADRVGLEIDSVETIECLPEFSRLGRPVVELEKTVTRVLRNSWFEPFRAVIVALLRKPALE